jgi:aminoglycoside phosphotransferase (APT) family kinase protein
MTGLADVRDVHRFDVAALDRYLTERVAGFRGPTAVRQFQGGQSNPTYLLETPGQKYVLRRKPPGRLLPSAHAVEREYQVITALARTDVPVPRTYLLCEDPAVIGTSFYVMDYVGGRVFRDPTLPDLGASERAAVYDSMNDVLACLHLVDWGAMGLGGFGKPGNYFARQIHRWTSQYRASETERIDSMERLIAWLPAHVPPGDETTLIHGDYRLGNMLIHPTEPRVVAVLDWELSTLGHPLGDLAYNCLAWRFDADLEGLVGKDVTRLGIPSEEAYVERYCRRTGRAGIPDWEFYIAFAGFRFAAIWQGVIARVLAGTANDPTALQHRARARALADVAWAIVPRSS